MVKSKRSVYSSTSVGTAPSGGKVGTITTGGVGFNPAPNIPVVIQFSLTPRQSNTAIPINYKSTTGINLFNNAILKLPDLFSGESKSINLLNWKFSERAKQSRWMEAGANIKTIPNSTGTPRNLITIYGRLIL